MKYEKPTLTIEQQIAVLQTRGLIIDDEDEAKNILDKISYFRLADYWRPLEIDKSSHRFKSNTHLCDIISIYRFDTELKQLIFNAIMQIEITTRSKMIRYFSADHTPFWFADENLCENKECFLSNIAHIRREINRSQEDFITEHFEKYDFPEFPPAWKTLEVITLGTLSKLYTNFSDNTAKNQMAKDFGLPQHLILGSWLASITVLRNKCAHHGVKNANTRTFSNLKVTFGDGSIICESKIINTMIECVKKIGPENIEKLGIIYRKNNLIYSAGRKPKDYETIVSGQYYLRKGIGADKAKELLNEISDKLGLALNIEVI